VINKFFNHGGPFLETWVLAQQDLLRGSLMHANPEVITPENINKN